jgi:hypothetical protein
MEEIAILKAKGYGVGEKPALSPQLGGSTSSATPES